MMGFGDEEGLPPTCSRAGCVHAAQWKVNWRNPRIHPKERVKIWLACDDHRDYLHDYLSSRGFPVIVTPLAVSVDRVPDAPAGTP